MAQPSDLVPDPRLPAERLSRLLDRGSLEPLDTAAEHDPDSGVLVVRGRVDGVSVIAYATDATVMGGAIGLGGGRTIAAAIEAAVAAQVPVIGVWHSGGARLGDGVSSLDGAARMFAAMTRASGKVPQISVVLGPSAGAAAYGPALTDVVIMAEEGRVFVTGPDVVHSVTGEVIDMASLGGGEPHSRRSGVVHLMAIDENDAFRRARRVTTLLGRPGLVDLDAAAERPALAGLLPERPERAYDVHPLVNALLDTPSDGGPALEELQPRWAPNVVIGLGRLAGRTVGVIANNPLRKGGCLDSLSAEKSARFVRMCDAFGVPLVVLVDVPGYLPGVAQEWEGVVRRGAKLLHAFAEAVVPRVTVVTRKAYGGAYIAMNAHSLGATAVFAWPKARIAVMGAPAAVGILHRRRLAAAPDHEREDLRQRLVTEQDEVAGAVSHAIDLGVVDAEIRPELTAVAIAGVLARVPATRGNHGNIPL